MARGRFISKEISLDIKVEALSDDTSRLLFTWLIAHLDCEGRMYGEAHIIKAQVFPRRHIAVVRIEKYLKEMELLGLIRRYSVNNSQLTLNFSRKLSENFQKVQFLSVPNFEKHQTGLRKDKEAPSVIPAPPDNPPPPIVPTKDGLGSGKGKLKSKLKVSLSLSKEDVDKIRGEFPDLESFDHEIDNFLDYWNRQAKPFKVATKALRNWMIKAELGNKNHAAVRPGGSFSNIGDIPSDEELDK